MTFRSARQVAYTVAAALGIGTLAGVLTFFLFTNFGVHLDFASLAGVLAGCMTAFIVIMDEE